MRVLIVDDERKARETIKELIKRYCPEVTAIYEADSVQAGVSQINKEEPDLVLLDVDLTNGSGFDVIREIGDKKMNVIFVTGSDEFALKAFKLSALDYILKPIDPAELSAAIATASKKINTGRLSENIETFSKNIEHISQGQKRMVLKTADSIHVVNIADIVFCEADRNYTNFHLIGGEKIMVSKSLGEYEELLPADSFLRVHQSYLVNINQIKRYERADGGFLVTSDEKTVPVSTRKKEQLIQFLSRY